MKPRDEHSVDLPQLEPFRISEAFMREQTQAIHYRIQKKKWAATRKKTPSLVIRLPLNAQLAGVGGALATLLVLIVLAGTALFRTPEIELRQAGFDHMDRSMKSVLAESRQLLEDTTTFRDPVERRMLLSQSLKELEESLLAFSYSLADSISPLIRKTGETIAEDIGSIRSELEKQNTRTAWERSAKKALESLAAMVESMQGLETTLMGHPGGSAAQEESGL